MVSTAQLALDRITLVFSLELTRFFFYRSSFADDAEATCEKHLALAATLDPTDPEVYHVSLSTSGPV